jgi:hypothetical protein
MYWSWKGPFHKTQTQKLPTSHCNTYLVLQYIILQNFVAYFWKIKNYDDYRLRKQITVELWRQIAEMFHLYNYTHFNSFNIRILLSYLTILMRLQSLNGYLSPKKQPIQVYEVEKWKITNFAPLVPWSMLWKKFEEAIVPSHGGWYEVSN